MTQTDFGKTLNDLSCIVCNKESILANDDMTAKPKTKDLILKNNEPRLHIISDEGLTIIHFHCLDIKNLRKAVL